jgi:sulfide dehydrogenase cytochrome subunit
MSRLMRLVQAASLTGLLVVGGLATADVGGVLTLCAGCHGEDGRGTDADTPIIAGIPAIVQEDAIFAYIDGDRNCGSKPMMCKAVAKLTEDQVVELAEHFSAMPFVPAGEEFDPALAERGEKIHAESCAICHAAGDPSEAEASILHGQRMGYLRYALQQYVAGERLQAPAMEKKTSGLSEDDIEALLNYYASSGN